MEILSDAQGIGYSKNKDVLLKKIEGIYIEKFRTLSDRNIILGDNITLISGKNGTMKSSILGLIAHPFSSPNNACDIFKKPLKTSMSEVFRMSAEKDNDRYKYYIKATAANGATFMEPVRMYKRPNAKSHRITVGKDNEADRGNFLLNTSYINLKRLFPIVDTNANIIEDATFTKKEKEKISDAYLMIMTRDSFSEFDCISDYKEKNTLGPKNASYDFNSISSGEDNLGNILMKMLAFERYQTGDDNLQGIFCIDEIEASLHPVALTNLFDYLLKWSKEFHIQIVATTHSLYLIEYALKYQAFSAMCKKEVCINIISTAHVGSDKNYVVLNNPSFRDAYRELTLKNPEDAPLFKVNVLCEDDVAIKLIKKIIAKKEILDNLEFISNINGDTGTPSASLIALGKNGAKLLDESIIILDSDVEEKRIKKVKLNQVEVFILPDKANINGKKGLAIEKDIIKFVSELNGDHILFAKEEKAVFLNGMHHLNIKENRITDKDNIDKYKNWCATNKKDFNKYLVYYVKESPELFQTFRNDFLVAVNKKRSAKGLPLLSYK